MFSTLSDDLCQCCTLPGRIHIDRKKIEPVAKTTRPKPKKSTYSNSYPSLVFKLIIKILENPQIPIAVVIQIHLMYNSRTYKYDVLFPPNHPGCTGSSVGILRMVYNGLSKSLYNWVVFHPLYILSNQGHIQRHEVSALSSRSNHLRYVEASLAIRRCSNRNKTYPGEFQKYPSYQHYMYIYI